MYLWANKEVQTVRIPYINLEMITGLDLKWTYKLEKKGKVRKVRLSQLCHMSVFPCCRIRILLVK